MKLKLLINHFSVEHKSATPLNFHLFLSLPLPPKFNKILNIKYLSFLKGYL